MSDETGRDNASERQSSSRPQAARKLLLTPEEAAAVLSIGRTRVYELIGRGELEAVRIGTSRRVPLVALERFVSQLLAHAVRGAPAVADQRTPT